MTQANKQNDLPTAQVLIVDDEPDHAEVMAEALRRLGHVCTLVHDLPTALDELKHGQFDLVVTDLKMQSDTDGMDVLAAARQSQQAAETVMVTAHGDIPTAKQAIKGGAYEFIEKPIDLDVLRTLCTRALETVFLRAQNTELRQRVDDQFGFDGIIGQSSAMREVIAKLKQAAPANIPVLITGESGTGKELFAQAIHNNSPRSKKRFVPLNCAGLTENLLEDELFGHVRGAFTDAAKDREGRFEFANGGTLFLDEIGDMPLTMQPKLLRVLESGEVIRVGANESKHVDVRLVSATNHDLETLVKEGKFRSDLFFRIRGMEIRLPALRERRDDIPLLVQHYTKQFAEQMQKPGLAVAEDAMSALMQYDWPGNVRQLINAVQNAVIVCDAEKIEPRHLPPEVARGTDATPPGSIDTAGLSLDQLEKQAIRNALQIHSGNREKAAKMLGIGERTLYRKLNEYGLK
ncbi:MAG: sigma-54-dependent transcriptional regulator [Phycisphaeraceae bacterium]